MAEKGPQYNRIKEVLKAQGRSQKWLAEQIGRSRKTVNEYCQNISQPSLDVLFEIARTLGVDPCDLLGSGEKEV